MLRIHQKNLPLHQQLMGPAEVTFHSQDDKAKVFIVLTTASKQEPMVTLPDHDFVVAPKHNLIPSVIGDMRLVKRKYLRNDPVTYSGATDIGIRSDKHSASSAFAHFQDMMREAAWICNKFSN